LLDFDLPWNNDQIYTDDVEDMTQAAQLERGIQPQYVVAALQSLSRDGELPDGYSSKDMRDTKSEFYNDVVSSAGEIQQYFESQQNNGTGGNGNGMSPEQWRQARQDDLEMKNSAFNQLEALYQKSGGGPLSSEEQFQIMSDPELLEQFGIAIQQSVENNGGSKSDKKKVAAVVDSAKTEKAEVSKDDSAAVEEGDDPELTSLIEGADETAQPTNESADETAQPTNESSITFEQNMERIKNLSYEDVQKDLSGPGLERALSLIDKAKSGEATAKEQQSLAGLLPVPAPKAKKREVTIDNLTPGDIRESIPGGPNQTKSLNLLRMVNEGNASDEQVEELMAMLDLDKK
jgi:hypothetical protein